VLEVSETWLLGRGLLKSVLPFISGAPVIAAPPGHLGRMGLQRARIGVRWEKEKGQQCGTFVFFPLETFCYP
jgi:hypothetical protein